MAYYELSRSSASLSKTYINRDGTENFNFPLHFHTSYEILYVHDGEIEVVIDKSVYFCNAVAPNNIFHPECPSHQNSVQDSCKLFAIGGGENVYSGNRF